MKSLELIVKIESKIKTLVNHFKQKPLNYYNEADIHAYIYHAFYRDKSFSKQYPTVNPDQKTVLIHREYPTFFKFERKIPIVPSERAERRGHYDFVVLNPEFVTANPFKVVVNNDFRVTAKETKVKPLLTAIEFKFITRKIGKGMINDIEMDFQKLKWTSDFSKSLYLLIFNRYGQIDEFFEEFERMSQESPEIRAIFVISYFDQGTKRTFEESMGREKL